MILLPNAPVAPYASCVYFYFTNDLLSTHHADRQSVDISVTVFVCVCTVTDFFPPRIKLAASNFSRRFIGVQGRESHIFVKFAPQKPKMGLFDSARATLTRM